MRIESPRYTECFGSVSLNDVQKVLELDSGRAKEVPLDESIAVQKIEEAVSKDIEKRMAVVIPIRDEKLPALRRGHQRSSSRLPDNSGLQ